MRDARLEHLYRTYAPVIYARCKRILQDRAAAEDATHETFMKVCRHLDRAPDGEQALAWIYRIATNHCLTVLRDARGQAEPHAQLPERAGDHAEPALLDALRVRALIGRLPEHLRAVVWLHFADGLSQEEVATVLGMSRRTVVNRLSELRVLLEADAAREVA